MEAYKSKFIQFLFDKGALKIDGPFQLKSKRLSPYFLNVGELNDGESTNAMGEYFAECILDNVGSDNLDLIFGPAYKGIAIAISSSSALADKGVNKGWAYNRKEVKLHGEATAPGKTKNDLQKELIVGYPIKDHSKTVLVDDVFTTGDTKYEALQVLDAVADKVKTRAVVIGADRQEINEDGETAIGQFKEDKNIPVYAVVNVSDIFDYLLENKNLSSAQEAEFKRYLTAWGTPEIKQKYGLEVPDLIEGKTVIPACDVPLERFEEIVKATSKIEKIGGYKIPATSGRNGWQTWVETARNYTEKPLIYDHQKAGTDIPDTGRDFMRELKAAGVNAVILFPQSGPRTQIAWTGEAVQQGLTVLIGGEMTHPKYIENDGGYIRDSAPEEIYLRAAKQGVRHFVVPGNKPDKIKFYRESIEEAGVNPVFFAPGFVAQGGEISKATEAAGDHWHAIVGRGIYGADDIGKAAKELTSKL